MTVLVSDSFNRADSTTTLGSTDSYNGGSATAWTALIGTWGISTNQAYLTASAGDPLAVVETGVADNFSVTFTASVYSSAQRLIWRCVASSSYWLIQGTQVWKNVAGSFTQVGTITGSRASGDVVKVSVSGNTHTIYINSVQVLQFTDAANSAGTKHGIGGNNTTVRYDNFQVDDLGATGTAYTASLSDSITTSETLTKSLSASKSDSVAMTETLTKQFSGFKSLSDTLTTSDSLNKRLTVTMVDTVTASESSSKADSKAFSDSIATSDSLSSTKGKAVNLSDSVAIADTISKVISRFQTDTVALSETKSDAIHRGIFDALTASDAITISKGKAILLSDTISLTDSIGKAVLLNKIETLLMSDAISQTKALHVQLYDVLVTTETFSKQIPNAPVIIGTVELKGSRELYIYLIGSRELTVNLKGGLPVAEDHQNIAMYAGESKIVGFTAYESDKVTPLPLTGAVIKWGMRRRNGLTNALYKDTDSGIAITDAAAGKFTVTFDPVDTASLSGDYEHQAEVVDANGKESLLATGRVEISKNIFKG